MSTVVRRHAPALFLWPALAPRSHAYFFDGWMAVQLNEQCVVVTGGAYGLGSAVTRALAREGACVVINYYRSDAEARALASELGDRLLTVQADITDADAVQAMFKQASAHFGRPVTGLVNNALTYFRFDQETKPKRETQVWDHLEQPPDSAVKGCLNTMQAAIPGMRQQGYGRIVNIGMNLFPYPVVPYRDYSAAQSALLWLTRTAATTLGSDGITVNIVSGGLLSMNNANPAAQKPVFDLVAGFSALRPITSPEGMANAVMFFLSPYSRAVTGQEVIVDNRQG